MIINLKDITISNEQHPLISNGNLTIDAGERVCLIGRNGAGKSTLLRVILGEQQPDYGSIERKSDLKISLLTQVIPEKMPGSVTQIVEKYLPSTDDDWQHTAQVAKTISKLKLDGDLLYDNLSGGMKRLVLLSCALIQEPDVLMLDEPTNHLDIETITLLENMLLSFNKTLIFVTHDRELLQKLATHIVEIDNGRLISWRGTYYKYLEHKETLLEAEAKANALFDKKLAQEEQWIRQGIKARRTRNEGRVRQLKKMRTERNARRTRPGQISITQTSIQSSGKIVFEASHLNFSYAQKTIVNDFSTLICRGDKVGIIGPNGVGKSTLINLLLGNITPSEGSIKHGTKLEIGYFDQHRLLLDPEKTVAESVGELSDTITIDNKQKHILSYLQDFLFTPLKARTAIKNLSGGERNRVMLAKLFSRPCNVLVLDEPTNDLDIETLELLEEQLLNYTGTLLLISHDRAFLNNVVTSTLVFTENGKIEEYVGGFDDWQKYRLDTTSYKEQKAVPVKNIPPKPPTKLSYKEQRELAELPNKIEKLEARQAQITQNLATPEFYKEHQNDVANLNQELLQIEKELEQCYARWQELEK